MTAGDRNRQQFAKAIRGSLADPYGHWGQPLIDWLDFYRYGIGMDFERLSALAKDLTGIEPAEFDEIIRAAEERAN